MAAMETSSRRPRRVRRTPEQIRLILEKYERGNQTAHEFIAAEGIALSTLWAWRRRYGLSSRGRRPRFVEVGGPGISALSGAATQVRFADGLAIELRPGFAVEAVAQLVQLLRRE